MRRHALRTASPSTPRSSSSATSASTTPPPIVKAAAPDITGLYVGQHIQFGGTGQRRRPRRTRSLRPRSGSAAASASSGAWTTPCTSADPRQRDDDPERHVRRDRARSPTSPSGTRTRSRARAQACSSDHSGTRAAFEVGRSTTMNNSAGTFNLTPSSSYTLQVLRHPAEPDRPARRALVEQHDEEADRQGRALHRRLGDDLEQLHQRVRRAGDALPLRHVHGSTAPRSSAAASPAGSCDFAAWDPNADNLGIIANGTTAPATASCSRTRPGFQGSLYATDTVDVGNFAAVRRPDGRRHASSSRTIVRRTSSRRSPRCRSAGRATRRSTPNPSPLRTIRGRAAPPAGGFSPVRRTFTESESSSVCCGCVVDDEGDGRSGSRARFIHSQAPRALPGRGRLRAAVRAR